MWNTQITKTLSLRKRHHVGGGQERIDKQHAKGKMTALERIRYLLDPDSFHETDSFFRTSEDSASLMKETFLGDGVICGWGTIHGRRVCVASEDFTVIGGTLGEIHAKKICEIQDLAYDMRVPIILLGDSGGARIEEGILSLSGYGGMFQRHVRASGVIPQISVIMGPCAGGAVYSPALTDFIFMVKGTSQMFITGPQVIKSVTGESVTAEALGGAAMHSSRSGCAHFAATSEEACIAQIKQLLSYLPQNFHEQPPAQQPADDPTRENAALNTIVPDHPNQSYDMYDVLRSLADGGEYFESQAQYAKNIITAFLRMDGKPVGVIASQPKVMAGCLDINASDKASRFIRTCDCFNVPLLTIEDVPGFLPGTQQEYGGIIRHGAKLLYAYSEATVPKLTLITRKAYGGAYIGMCSKHLGADMVFAWPTAEIAVMGASGAANIIFSKDIKAAEDPAECRKEKIAEYEQTMMNPYVAASRGYVDDVIVPAETRKTLIRAFQALSEKQRAQVEKKHGNIPL